jgi:TonB family protein
MTQSLNPGNKSKRKGVYCPIGPYSQEREAHLVKMPINRILLVLLSVSAALPVSGQTPEERRTEARTALNSGVKVFKEGNAAAAVDLFTRALQLDPDFIQAELYLATAHASMYTPGQPTAQNQETGRKAIELFERVLQKQPDSVDAVAGLAKMYSNSGDPAKARDFYLRLTKISLQDPIPFYSVGALDWMLASNKTNPLPRADKLRLIDEGLQNVDIALTLNPQLEEAMTYKNLLLRQKADTIQDPAESARLTEEADRWFSRALEARRQSTRAGQTATGQNFLAAGPPPPPPPPPPPLPPPQGAVRVGGDAAQANLISTVTPTYPALARAARIQGVVLLQTFIDKAGSVVNLSVLSGHPLLNEAAIEAVRQWRYQPILLNGQPVDVVTTVTVNFTFQ